MKLLLICGNHPRHIYFLNKISERFDINGAIVEIRENLLPIPPNEISDHDKINFNKHFKNREKSEQKFFGNHDFPKCSIFKTASDKLNSENTSKFVRSINPDIALIFGSHLIKEPLYSSLPYNTINLHLGLSPRYRGDATLFWPFYFLEPTYAGSTFHYIISEPDAGNIIHQVVPTLESSDGIHDVACKTVIASTNDVIKLLEIFEKNKTFSTFNQKSGGKNFLNTDFKPEHLRMIYDVFNDDIVKQYLDGNLHPKTPRLYKQF